MEFGEKLKRLRKQHDLGQADLAAKAGLSTNKIQRYEQSGQKPKGEDTLALARALGVTADYLLDDDLPYPPPQEHLSEKVAVIQRLEGLIAALRSRRAPDEAEPALADRPDVVHLPVFKLGAGFDVQFDAAGAARGEQVRDLYATGLQDARCFAAELYGTSMQAPGGRGFSPGETLVFRIARPEEIAPGDYVYVRAGGQALFRQAFVHGDRFRLRALNPADREVDVGRAEIEHVARLVRRVKDY